MRCSLRRESQLNDNDLVSYVERYMISLLRYVLILNFLYAVCRTETSALHNLCWCSCSKRKVCHPHSEAGNLYSSDQTWLLVWCGELFVFHYIFILIIIGLHNQIFAEVRTSNMRQTWNLFEREVLETKLTQFQPHLMFIPS